jgi:pimeloyl-ACP methyl ester carboxylesterase
VTPTAHHSAEPDIFSSESGPEGAPLVVLIHGSLDRSSGMARIARQLQASYRVIRFDRRGYGTTWNHPGPFTVEGNAEDVIELLSGREAVLVGHSFGGHVALRVADQLGSQITGVSTYETPLSWMSWWPNTTAGSISLAASPQEAAEKFMIRLVGQKIWDALPEKTKNERRQEGPALTGELGSLRQSVPWDISRIFQRTICGYGSLALEHHVRGANWLADNLPNATLEVIDGARHGAHTSHAKEFVHQLVMPHFAGNGTLTVMS